MFDLHSCCVDSCAVEEAWSSNFEARQRGGQRCRYHPTFTPWGLPPRGVDDEDDDGHCRHEELMRKMLMGMVTTIQELLLPSFASDIAVVFLWSVMNHQMILNVVGEQVLIAVIIVLPLLHLKVLNTLSCSTTLMSDGPGQRGKKLKHNWNPDLLQKWSSISEKNMSLVAFTRRCFLQLCSPLAKWSVEQDRRLQMGDHSYSRLPL